MADIRPPAHGGNIYAAQRQHGGFWGDFIDFSANINPMGLSPAVETALKESLGRVSSYPDPDAWELCQAIAATYDIADSGLLLGNGAVELIFQICRTLAPTRILLPAPTFLEYAAAADAMGIPVYHVPMVFSNKSVAMPIKALCAEVRVGDMLFLCNPNNPTGSIHTAKELEPLLHRTRDVGAWLVIDESFIDFRPIGAAESCRGWVDEHPGLIILHSLTKFLAIPGLRLGFLLAGDSSVKRLARGSIPWNINVPAQAAGVAGMRDATYRIQSVNWIQKEKERFTSLLAPLSGVSIFPPSVNFVLLDIRNSGRSVADLQKFLWAQRIMVRNCVNFYGLSSGHMRLAIRQTDQNDRLAAILGEILGKEGEA